MIFFGIKKIKINMEENRMQNMKRKEKYRIRKLIYILLIVLIVLNVFFISHGNELNIPSNNQIDIQNRDNVNNNVNTPANSNIKKDENKEAQNIEKKVEEEKNNSKKGRQY